MTLGANSYYMSRERIEQIRDGAGPSVQEARWLAEVALRDGPDGDSPPIHLIRDEALETGFWHGVHVAQRIARESSKEAYDNIESHLYGPDIEALKRSVCDATGGEGS